MITNFELFEAEKHSMGWWNEINTKIDDTIKSLDDNELITLVKELVDNKISKDNMFLFLRDNDFGPAEILTLVKIRLKKIRPDIYQRVIVYKPEFKINVEDQLKRKRK
jgi:hypothetical protein